MSDPVRFTIAEENDQKRLVVIQRVKPQRREQFEQFVSEVLCPAAGHLLPGSACEVKIVAPCLENEDGTYTYALLIEPALQKINYSFETILKEVYGEELGSHYTRQWQETLSTPGVETALVDEDGQLTPCQ